mgnify:CR=1 FL=1
MAMNEVFLKEEKVKDALRTLMQKYIVVCPVGGTYSVLTEDLLAKVDIERRGCPPPKLLFLPPKEKMFEYVLRDGVEVKALLEELEGVLFLGLRACDLKALEVLDKVLLEEPADTYYKAKRERVAIISLDCAEPSDSCFCVALGLKPYAEGGFDLNMSRVSGGYVLEAGSDRGKELLTLIKEFTEDASSSQLEERQKKREEVAKRLEEKYVIKSVAEIKEGVKSLEDEYFEGLAEKCVECFGCIYSCPTCYCFYVFEESEDETWRRVRIWDPCLSEAFQRVAAGVNPRAKLAERLKQRFFHKLVYFVERYGEVACVGCGRCVDACLARIDIREVIGVMK